MPCSDLEVQAGTACPHGHKAVKTTTIHLGQLSHDRSKDSWWDDSESLDFNSSRKSPNLIRQR